MRLFCQHDWEETQNTNMESAQGGYVIFVTKHCRRCNKSVNRTLHSKNR